ncbi:hypothetical protein MNV49_005612 [Pseudohyphozyma bogoriensis]|nr:hypothetical protein MNV49_005612 [Pseudohyphozyma bogoriensis]
MKHTCARGSRAPHRCSLDTRLVVYKNWQLSFASQITSLSQPSSSRLSGFSSASHSIPTSPQLVRDPGEPVLDLLSNDLSHGLSLLILEDIMAVGQAGKNSTAPEGSRGDAFIGMARDSLAALRLHVTPPSPSIDTLSLFLTSPMEDHRDHLFPNVLSSLPTAQQAHAAYVKYRQVIPLFSRPLPPTFDDQWSELMDSSATIKSASFVATFLGVCATGLGLMSDAEAQEQGFGVERELLLQRWIAGAFKALHLGRPSMGLAMNTVDTAFPLDCYDEELFDERRARANVTARSQGGFEPTDMSHVLSETAFNAAPMSYDSTMRLHSELIKLESALPAAFTQPNGPLWEIRARMIQTCLSEQFLRLHRPWMCVRSPRSHASRSITVVHAERVCAAPWIVPECVAVFAAIALALENLQANIEGSTHLNDLVERTLHEVESGDSHVRAKGSGIIRFLLEKCNSSSEPPTKRRKNSRSSFDPLDSVILPQPSRPTLNIRQPSDGSNGSGGRAAGAHRSLSEGYIDQMQQGSSYDGFNFGGGLAPYAFPSAADGYGFSPSPP